MESTHRCQNRAAPGPGLHRILHQIIINAVTWTIFTLLVSASGRNYSLPRFGRLIEIRSLSHTEWILGGNQRAVTLRPVAIINWRHVWNHSYDMTHHHHINSCEIWPNLTDAMSWCGVHQMWHTCLVIIINSRSSQGFRLMVRSSSGSSHN